MNTPSIPDGKCFWNSFHDEIFPRLLPMFKDEAAYGLLEIVHKTMSMPGRFYHNSQHVLNMFQMAKRLKLTLKNEEVLAILFHDIVYMPGDSNNEYDSSSMCCKLCDFYITDKGIVNKAMGIINATRRPCGMNELREYGSALVCDLDIARMLNEETRIEDAIKIEHECKYFLKCDRKTFLEKRIEFLKAWSEEEQFFYSSVFTNTYCSGFGTLKIVNNMMRKVLKSELSRCRGILGHLRK